MLLFTYLPAHASTPFNDLVAESAILAEAYSGQILFEYSAQVPHPADALARIMTLLLTVSAIENGEAHEDERIEMTESAWVGIPSRATTLNIRPGEIMSLRDLMFSAFVGGAAEACNMIAEHIAGSVDDFIIMMNERAVELGAENTTFTNTYGVFNENQLTTAHDQFVIFKEAITYPLFLEISGVFRHTTEETNRSDARNLTGSNHLLNQAVRRYFYGNNISGMASITFEGGHSFVGLSESDGLLLIAVILGSDEIMLPNNAGFDMRNLSEAIRLFEWGYSQFEWRTILTLTDFVGRAPIEHGAGVDYVNLRPESEIILLLNRDVPDETFVRTITLFNDEDEYPLMAPIEAGVILGEISIVRDGVEYGPVLLIASTNVDLHNFEFIRRQVIDLASSQTARNVMLGLAILVLCYFVLVIRYNVMRRKRIAKIAQAKQKLAEDRRISHNDEYEHHSIRPRSRQESRHTQTPRSAPKAYSDSIPPRQNTQKIPRQDPRLR